MKSLAAPHLFIGLSGLLGFLGCSSPAPCTGCLQEDTCSGGNNMTSPVLANGIENGEAGPFLRILWEAGDSIGEMLPAAYFDRAAVSEQTDATLARDAQIQHTAERELLVRVPALTDYSRNHESATISFAFPDRRDFIECSHPGSDDRYELAMTLHFDASAALTRVDVQQTVVFGNY